MAPKKWAQKIDQYSTQKFPFYQEIINSFLLCEIYQKLGILNAYLWVKYSMAAEKNVDFMKKHARAT